MPILVLAEHDGKMLHAATAKTVGAAQKCGADVHVLVIGQQCSEVAQQASQLQGISKVIYVSAAQYAYPLPENIAPLIHSIAADYSHMLAAATSTGKDIMPRVAALLGVGQISEIIDVVTPDTFRRPIYAGNAIETVQSSDAIKIITVRATAFDAVATTGGNTPIDTLAPLPDAGLSQFVRMDASHSERPELTSARIVVSGGRGLGSKENFAIIERFADTLGAAVGASRAAVDSGYVPNDYQVGQTGKIVAPELYIAVGISGAIQHLAGMKDSKVIVAINKDENAPIFEVADYGLVADLFTAIPEIEEALSK